MCILELGKVLMYEFHCDYIENKYGKNSELLSTDTTDSLYEIKTEYAYEDFSSNKEMFNFSIYSTNQNIMIIQTN